MRGRKGTVTLQRNNTINDGRYKFSYNYHDCTVFFLSPSSSFSSSVNIMFFSRAVFFAMEHFQRGEVVSRFCMKVKRWSNSVTF